MVKQLESKKESHLGPTLNLEEAAWNLGFKLVAGVDEAGRGPLAGPVVVAAVILGKDWKKEHALDDSKKLSEKKRNELFEVIQKEAVGFKIISISPSEIDKRNILQATLYGMARCIEEIEPKPDLSLIDGNQYPQTVMLCETVVKGDQISKSIAAASILAKVSRDRMMLEYADQFPEWGFEKHKGYPTKQHRLAISEFGLCPIHRRSFRVKPVPKKQETDLRQMKLL